MSYLSLQYDSEVLDGTAEGMIMGDARGDWDSAKSFDWR